MRRRWEADATGRASPRVAIGVLLAGVGYWLTSWYHYGRIRPATGSDELLDRFMPVYEVRERHETRVKAPAQVTFAAARALELGPVARDPRHLPRPRAAHALDR